MNQQTAHIDPEKVAEKVRAGKPITLAELSVHTGYAYSTVRTWTWLPLLDGKLFYDDFVIARRRVTGLEADPRFAARRPKSIAGKFD